MASLVVYNTDIIPSKNMGIENIDKYLDTKCNEPQAIIFNEIRDIKPDQELWLTLDVDDSLGNVYSVNDYFPYNYAVYESRDLKLYFFMT